MCFRFLPGKLKAMVQEECGQTVHIHIIAEWMKLLANSMHAVQKGRTTMSARVIATQLPLDEQWETARALVNRAFRNSLHYAFASVNADGTPHVTPIGSMLLRAD